MKNILRHISIAMVAGLFAFLVIPNFGGKIKNVTPSELRIYSAVISALLWFSCSCFIEKSTLKKWLVFGFISPFLGFPLVFRLAATYPHNSFITGFQIALLFSWILIPGGLLMGFCASFISRYFELGNTK